MKNLKTQIHKERKNRKDNMASYEITCRKCKGIINTNEHRHYKSKYGQRHFYICSDNCIEWYLNDHYGFELREELIKDCKEKDFTKQKG